MTAPHHHRHRHHHPHQNLPGTWHQRCVSCTTRGSSTSAVARTRPRAFSGWSWCWWSSPLSSFSLSTPSCGVTFPGGGIRWFRDQHWRKCFAPVRYSRPPRRFAFAGGVSSPCGTFHCGCSEEDKEEEAEAEAEYCCSLVVRVGVTDGVSAGVGECDGAGMEPSWFVVDQRDKRERGIGGCISLPPMRWPGIHIIRKQ